MQSLLPDENCLISLDFQHLKELKGRRLSENVSLCVRTWIPAHLQPSLSKTARLSTTVISTHSLAVCTHGRARSLLHTHAHALYSVPLASADSGYTATKRTDKELTSPGRLARSQSLAFVDKIYTSAAALRTSSSCFHHQQQKTFTCGFSSILALRSGGAVQTRI